MSASENRIVPEHDIRDILLRVENPGRYIGGEFGIQRLDENAVLTIAISFPDLYEIGMSNSAVKILYDIFNSIEGVRCERVFSPAQDFEEALRNRSIPLFSLETGSFLGSFDIIAFSIGYELAATNLLAILDAGNIPFLCESRTDRDPIVIAGGPAITNPVPFGRFLDAVFIGEAEAYIRATMETLVALKRKGAGRDDLLYVIRNLPMVWYRGISRTVRGKIWNDFGKKAFLPTNFPVPTLKAVQDNGTIEIMRGCPHGCRFCHAGVYYRPQRVKNIREVIREADFLIHSCGYREITLSSLSSGDYEHIGYLIRIINRRYKDRSVSCSLPSLKVDSFTLPLLTEISHVRKSGLTFAVETPVKEWQFGLNKTADLENSIRILRQAKESGWNLAKFYFMIGLPVSSGFDEADHIVGFLEEILANVRINLNINIGTFIPKAHTPFQWAKQIQEQEAIERIKIIRNGLKGKNVKVGFHAPFQSCIEGIISRGDERVGDLLLRVFKNGARFDAWEDLIRKDIWRSALADAAWHPESEVLAAKPLDADLPWDCIRLGVSKSYLRREYEKSLTKTPTDPCDDPCTHPCGACNDKDDETASALQRYTGTEDSASALYVPTGQTESETSAEEQCEQGKIVFSFSKQGKAIFFSHLTLMNVFEKALSRTGIPLKFTEGYNPKPKLEFAQPLSLGMSSIEELAGIEIRQRIQPESFVDLLNTRLPSGFEILHAVFIPDPADGRKHRSLMNLYAGSDFKVSLLDTSAEDTHRLQSMVRRIQELSAINKGIMILETAVSSVTFRMLNGSPVKTKELLREFWGEHPLSRNIDVCRIRILGNKENGDVCALFDLFASG